MKVNLKPLSKFQVFNEAGQSLGEFEVTSEWKGFMELRRANGSTLILERAESSVGDLITRVLTGNSAISMDVVKCSPSLLEDIQRKVT